MPVKLTSCILGLIVGILFFCGQSARQAVTAEDASVGNKLKAKTNRLGRETSPYLLMHAQNPVDWYPWGPEAFEKARKEGKLIFLSVGYSSCYWCHVMERKVFLNEQIARTLNENFVCIKVDREERPDIDDVYMTALQVYYQLIQSPSTGGWPLSMFLTPDGKPLAGGTYFPPEDTDGASGFPTVLERLTDLWKNKQKEMEGNAQTIAESTRRVMRPRLALPAVQINDALVVKSFDAVTDSIDPEFGGIDFNPQRPIGPKFPTPAKLLFLQEFLKKHGDLQDAAALVHFTLMQIACGGIRDHIGGGFHRYSVDRQWQIPHFEKMLYDQAQLADVFVNAYVSTQDKFFKQVAEETLLFVEREMTSADGGFYSALDAETNGVEGEFYVWEAHDIDRLLGDKSAQFKDFYHVKELSDFEQGNVLRLSVDQLPGPAREGQVVAGSGTFEFDEFSALRQKLLVVRNQRPKLLRDEKILSGWNGLMIGAFTRAGTSLNQPQFVRTAEKAGSFLLTKLLDSQGRLLHTYTAGQAKLNAYLDDYAFVIDGLLALHESTKDPKWLRAAKQLQDDQLKMFRDEPTGGFYFTSHQHEELLARTKNCYDSVVPAGNSVSARNLLKLARLTSNESYRDEARTIVELFASNLDQNPRALTVLALAMSELLATEQPQRQSSAQAPGTIVQVAADDKKKPSEPLVILAEQKEETPKKDEVVKAKAYLAVDRLPAGSSCQIIVLIDVKKGWHINANPPKPDNLIPVKVTWKSKNGVKLAEVKYPAGKGFKFEGDDEEAMVYEGEVQIRGTLQIPKEAAGATEELQITVDYQACNEKGCLAPKSIKLTGKLPVAKQGEAVRPINASLFGSKVDASR